MTSGEIVISFIHPVSQLNLRLLSSLFRVNNFNSFEENFAFHDSTLVCIHTHTIRIFFKPPAFVHFPTSFPNCQDTWITGIHQNEATKTRVRGGLVDLPTRKDVYRHSEILVAVTLLAVSNLTKDFFAKGRGLPWGEREGAKKSSYFFDGTERLIATLDNMFW